MWFDSHAHLDGFREAGALEAMLARADAAGVTRLVAVGGRADANAWALECAARHPERIVAAVGFDRDQAAGAPDVAALADTLDHPGAAAVGEIGLDYHYHPETVAAQRAWFAAQLALARERRRPVVVHSREADADTLALLRDHARAWTGDPARLGVVHCFTRGPELARALLELGYHVGISGIVTFARAAEVQAVARMIPEPQLLIETDTPYLAPAPHRGRPNEPAWAALVGVAVARLRECAPERLAELTTENARRLFARGDAR